jgi:hypothetical protein
MMKGKLINLLLILTSMAGFLEWGGGNRLFLFQAEAEVIAKFMHDPGSVIHPFILLPMAGQILLLITLFQKTPGKWITYCGLAGIGILLAFMFFVGLISLNYKIILSTLPFLVIAFIAIRYQRMTQSR